MSLIGRLQVRAAATLTLMVPVTPAAFPAEAETRLYVGHRARLTASIPAHWTVDPVGRFDYQGGDGFIFSHMVEGPSLQQACAAVDPAASASSEVTWSGTPACIIDSQVDDQAMRALVVRHPHPFAVFGQPMEFAVLMADLAHFDRIIDTLSFDPGAVTPEAYIDSVIDLVETLAWWSPDVDWTSARSSVRHSIDALPAWTMAGGVLDIVAALRAAGDNHSFVVPATWAEHDRSGGGFGFWAGGNRLLAVFPESPAGEAGIQVGDMIETIDGEPVDDLPPLTDPGRGAHAATTLTLRREGVPTPVTVVIEPVPYSEYLPPAGRTLAAGIGYLAIPAFTSFGQEGEFVATAHKLIAEIDREPVCGWIVDLRLNDGGAYHPMVTALGPVLGNGTFVGWQFRNGRQQWIRHDEGRIVQEGFEVANYLGAEPPPQLAIHEPPVAVLTSRFTGSSGEVTTLAFVGRPGTILVGSRTAGYTTANATIPLFDGTTLQLAGTAMVDRTGATHFEGITPDVEVAEDWSAFGSDRDPALLAALHWLREQPGCGGEPR